jgi:hypothetical protein
LPQRIQLSRAKGYRKPAGAIVVARPSKWGNPFRIGVPDEHGHIRSRKEAVDCYRAYLAGGLELKPPEGIEELAGHDLACWCPLEDERGGRVACHADVLLEVANSGRITESAAPLEDQRRARRIGRRRA